MVSLKLRLWQGKLATIKSESIAKKFPEGLEEVIIQGLKINLTLQLWPVIQ